MIRLTKQTDYGIVLMSRIANYGALEPARGLALSTHLPLPMVSKILKVLTRAGLLKSHRGAKGGYSLARASRDISVADLVTALEGPIAITECIEDTPEECSLEAHCGVRRNWQRINSAVRQALQAISLEDMAGPLDVGPALLRPPVESLVSLGASRG